MTAIEGNSTTHEDSLVGQPIRLRSGVELQVSHRAGRSPAVVFIHGGLGNRYNWRSQYEFAQAQGWQTLAYDLAGHGQSRPYDRYSIGRHRRDLSRLLHRFEIHAPVLCCHSYGVPIGLEWAQRHPTRALVLIAGGTHDLAPWWEIPLMKLLAWGGRQLYHLPWVQQLNCSVSSAHRHQTIEQFFVECPVPVDRSPYQALEIFWGYNFFSHRKHDRYLHVPTLVISGGKDTMFTYKMGEQLTADFDQARHLHLPDAGHLMIAEYPAIINEAIASLIHTLAPE